MDERGFSKQDAGTGYRHHKDSHRVSMASDIETIVEPLSYLTISDRMSSSKNTWMLWRTLGKGLHGMPLGLPSFRGVVALHPDVIAVTDHTSGRVIVYNTEGTVKRTIETTRNTSDIAATHDNRLVVVSDRAIDVKVFNKDNSVAFQFLTVTPSEVEKTAVELQSVAVKKDGTIIVGDVKRMVLTEHSLTDGSLIRTIPVKTKPYFLAVDSDDRIFIGDLYAVHVFAVSSDEQLFSIQPTIDGEPVKYCRGVCFHNSDIFVVTGTSDEGYIHRYGKQGKFLGCAVQGLRDPWGVTFTPDEQCLAVADRDSVKMYISDAALKTTDIREAMGSVTDYGDRSECSSGYSPVSVPRVRRKLIKGLTFHGPYSTWPPVLSVQGSRQREGDVSADHPGKNTVRHADTKDCESVFYGQSGDLPQQSFAHASRDFDGTATAGAARGKKIRRRKRNKRKKTKGTIADEEKSEGREFEVSCTQKAGNTSSSDQDKKSQKPRVSTHLQLVLDEFSKLTKNLSNKEQLGRRLTLSDIAVGYFSENGGNLSLDEYDVHLTIPRGAICRGPPRLVYIYVDPTNPRIDGVKPPEVALSPMIKCGPEGLRFEENVVLSFPHHATMLSPKYRQLAVRMRHDDPPARSTWERFDGNAAVLTEKRVILLVGHFTYFALLGTPSTSSGGSKRMKVGAFGGPLDPRCPYTFRVHFWDDERGVEQEVVRKENRLESRILDDFRNMEFYWSLGNLVVKVSDIEGNWIARGSTKEQAIYKDKIRAFPSNSVTFNLKRQAAKLEAVDDGGLYCTVCSYQCSENEDLKKQTEVCLSICPQQVMSHDSGRPQCMPGSGRCQRSEMSSRENKNDARCTCQEEASAMPSLCSYCKEQIGSGIFSIVHGVVDTQDYGGLPQEIVFALCNHVDSKRQCCNNWTELLEDMTNISGRSVRVVEDSGKIRTKDLLKLYFEVCRNNKKTNKEAVRTLVELFSKQGLDRAAEIVYGGLQHVN